MKISRVGWLLCASIGSVNAFIPSFSLSYEVDTHRAISTRALQSSRTDLTLRTELAVGEGIAEVAAGKRLTEWIGLGSIREDDTLRFLNHFHNPLRTWDAAGFRVPWPYLGLQIGSSSILWQQDEPHSGWSWWDARGFYFDALTRPLRGERDERLAKIFEALGHVVHLIQDAASPAHTRNDPHVGPSHATVGTSRTKGFNYETFVRGVASSEPAFLEEILAPVRVSATWGDLAGNPLAPLRVAALIDSERYDGSNPAITAEEPIGLAEYANANFFSEDRTFPGINPFTRFPFPARTSTAIAALPITLPSGESVTRQYYVKTGAGDVGYRLATVGFLRDYQLRFQLDAERFDQKTALDEEVYRDYARRLVPRAVGYSTALIDYFFRGRLDVGLVDEVDDPRVTGTNASDEPLAAGALFVYAEDAAGTRTLVSSPQGVAVEGPVAPGGRLPDVPLTSVPADASRLVAVYRGGLGNERPSGATPGAVVGKVFTPLRVEELYRADEHWMLRSPTVVATLPLTTAEFSQVKWGDHQDTIVARTDDPPRVVVYDVSRTTSGGDVVATGTPPVVLLTERTSASLPFAQPPTVTSVNWSDVVSYTQRLGRFTVTTAAVWHEPTASVPGFYDSTVEHEPVSFEIVHQQSLSFGGTFDVVLDAAHSGTGGSGAGPYRWFLEDVAADQHGRVLGLVVVYLDDPGASGVQVPVLAVDRAGTPTSFGETQTIAPGFPPEVGPLLWALVDLRDGRLIASTAEPIITIARTRAVEAPLRLFRRDLLVVTGGPAQSSDEWVEAIQLPRESVTADVEVATTRGDLSLSAAGWLRGDLAAALAASGLAGFGVAPLVRRSYYNYDCIAAVCGPGDTGMASYAVVDTQMAALAPPPQFFSGARATRPAGGERIVLLGDTQRGDDWPIGHLLTWDAEAARATVRLQLPPAFFRTLGPTPTAGLAMVFNVSSPFAAGDTYVVRLDPPEAPPAVFPATDLTSDFMLLDPVYLYNAGDMKFYRLQAPLEATALPTSLQAVDGNPAGSYHVVVPR
jgi:hypothetical protein